MAATKVWIVKTGEYYGASTTLKLCLSLTKAQEYQKQWIALSGGTEKWKRGRFDRGEVVETAEGDTYWHYSDYITIEEHNAD